MLPVICPRERAGMVLSKGHHASHTVTLQVVKDCIFTKPKHKLQHIATEEFLLEPGFQNLN